ncbi:LpqN/LpqT family lipoprotein [[Mycobacterium] holstebronense]|uniref:LpqN/LpqT family lipoprotein n=1 Tax=[Mycobacterium] holstebronense TaxID=3064288 RepID=A0ABN9NW65_9MYCO|nr:LpqN/LpqT family lipoprotein [Mycolicibacter sp. MU0102]CAJ1510903.1 LpqN/LpqT family lipoprotein [Mycolicibacter sp. MU0102]
MTNTAHRWRLLFGSAAVMAAGLAGIPVVAAEPLVPAQPNPYGPAAQAAAAPVTGPLAAAPRPGAPAPVILPPAGVPSAPAAVAPPSGLVPATSGTLRDYFAAKKVQLQPQQPAGFNAFNITLPMPAGWSHVPDPNVPDAFAVIADRRSGSLYTPNAQVVVYRLDGQFDPKEAITHGFVDSQTLMAWQTTNASLNDFNGFPSASIEGTYRDADMTLNTSRRHVIVPTDDAAYLVSLTVTTGAGRAIGAAPATDGIINGFRVERPGTNPPPPAPSGPVQSGTVRHQVGTVPLPLDAPHPPVESGVIRHQVGTTG